MAIDPLFEFGEACVDGRLEVGGAIMELLSLALGPCLSAPEDHDSTR